MLPSLTIFFQDDFNLTGLNSLVPYYEFALDMVLDVEMPMEDPLTEEQQEIVESAAEMLYGLIHARYVNEFELVLRPLDLWTKGAYSCTFNYSYIVTNRGMHAMFEKYRTAAFGRCPQVFCQGQPVLPVGLSDLPRNYTVNVFCPRCHGLFFPKSTRQANIDGAYFGTTFPHLYLITHPVSSIGSVRFRSWFSSSNFDRVLGYDSFKTDTNIRPKGVWLQSESGELILQEPRRGSPTSTNRQYSKAKSSLEA